MLAVSQMSVVNVGCVLQVSEEDAVGELTAPVAGVILTLMSNLRHCFLSDQSELTHLQNLSQFMTLLDGRVPDASSVSQASLDEGSTLRSVFSSLQVVLKGLLEHILRSSMFVFIFSKVT